jgi:tryptophanyl-tRNA synthetase
MEKENKVTTFGGEKLPLLKELEDSIYFKRDLFTFHKDLDIFLEACSKKEKTIIVLGFNPISEIHFGHLTTFKIAKYFQKKYGSEIMVIIPNEEAYFIEQDKSFKYFYDKSITLAKQIASLDLDKKKTHFLIDGIFPEIYNFGFKLSKKINLTTINSIYGFKSEMNMGLFFMPIIQSAQILSPQILFNTNRILTPIGANEDATLRLCRDLASKNGLLKPSAIYLDYIPGLDGLPMSRKRPESAIFIFESIDNIKKKISKALSGGRKTREDQEKLGGEVEKCIVYQYLSLYESVNNERLKKECLNGKLACSSCKKRLEKLLVSEILKYHEQNEKINLRVLDKMIIKSRRFNKSPFLG